MAAQTTSKQTAIAGSVGFIIGTSFYLALFYAEQTSQLASFPLLLLPDQVVMSWMGGAWSSFAVFDRLPIVTVASVVHLVAFCAGWLGLRALRLGSSLSRLEVIVFSSGVGLNLLSLFTLVVGLVGGLRFPGLFYFSSFAVVAAAGWQFVRNARRSHTTAVPDHCLAGDKGAGDKEARETDAGDKFVRWGWIMAVPFVAVMLAGSMLPPWEFDVREYHLQVPKEWYQAGRITFLPHNVYGNMPLGAETLAVFAMALMPGELAWWWGALVGKTIMASFSGLTALALFAAGRRFFSARTGLMAAVIYLGIPWVVHVSQAGLNEGVVGFYLFTALYAFLIWRQEEPPRHRQRQMLAGFLAGATAACKYTGVVFAVIPLAACTLLTPPRRDWRRTGIFLLAAAAACGLWYGKNWVLTGNPVYPMVFGGKTRTTEKMAQWERAHRVPPDERGAQFSMSQAAEAVARIGWRSELLSPLLWPLAIMAAWQRRGRKTICFVAGALALLFLMWWMTTHRIDRFWVPLLPMAAMLAGAGATWSEAKIWRVTCVVFIASGLLASFVFLMSPVRVDPSLGDDRRYLLSLESLREDRPEEPDMPSRVNPVHRYLNGLDDKDAKVLLVGDAQPFDLEIPVVYSTCFDECLFETMMRGRSRQERLAALNSLGITHVYFHWPDIDRYRSPGNYGFSDFVTRDLVHRQLVAEQQLLRPVLRGADAAFGELFEVQER